MNRLRLFVIRILNVFRRSKLDRDLSEQLRAHHEMVEADLIQRGMEPDSAALAARRAVGNNLLIHQLSREQMVHRLLDETFQDIRYTFRGFGRTLGFTFVAVLTLALGIGLNTAVFSVFNAVLLRPLTYPDPDRIVSLSPGNSPVAFPDFLELREQAVSFELLGTYNCCLEPPALRIADRAIRPLMAFTSGDFWAVTGARPLHGRLPNPYDGNVGVVLSYRAFQEYFQGDPEVVGRPFGDWHETIIGVLGKDFAFQFPHGTPGDPTEDIDAYQTVEGKFSSGDFVRREDSVSGAARVVGKLKPGVSIGQADAELKPSAHGSHNRIRGGCQTHLILPSFHCRKEL